MSYMLVLIDTKQHVTARYLMNICRAYIYHILDNHRDKNDLLIMVFSYLQTGKLHFCTFIRWWSCHIKKKLQMQTPMPDWITLLSEVRHHWRVLYIDFSEHGLVNMQGRWNCSMRYNYKKTTRTCFYDIIVVNESDVNQTKTFSNKSLIRPLMNTFKNIYRLWF